MNAAENTWTDDKHRRGPFTLGLAIAVMFMGSTLVTPLYGLYRAKFGFSELTLTLIYAAYVLGNVAALLFFGRVSDQIGRRRAALTCIAGAVVSSMLFLFAQNVAWLATGRVVSGLSTGLFAGTAAAWITDLMPESDRTRASIVTTCGNYAGLAVAPILSGTFAQYLAAPLHLSYLVHLTLLTLIFWLCTRVPESVPASVTSILEVSLRPRIGVPRQLRGPFLLPAVTAFATFALGGFFAALAPTVLNRTLHQSNLAVNGSIVAELFVFGFVAIQVTRRANSRRAMLSSLGILLLSLGFLALATINESMWLFLLGTAATGTAAGLGYRGSLEVVNEIAPADRRAEMISSFLVVGFLGNSVPVIGVGILTDLFNSVTAEAILAIVVALLAGVALLSAAFLNGRAK